MNAPAVTFFSRGRIKLVRQTEIAECGLACVAMIANYYGRETDLPTIRRSFKPSIRGSSLGSLIALADRLGMAGRAIKVPLERLEDLHFPAILHWDMTHFVVVEAVSRGRALIHNPDGSSRWMKVPQLSEHFTGIALELRAAEAFDVPPRLPRLRLRQLWQRVTGLKRAFLQVIALSIVLEAFALALPYFSQIAVDYVFPARDYDLLATLAIGFGLFTLLNAAAAQLRSFALLSVGTSASYGISVNVARRLFKLPTSWFEKRHVGDMLSRFQSVTPIRHFMTEGAVAAMIDGVLAALTLAMMFYYSVPLALLALLAFGAYALVRAISYAPQKSAQENAIIQGGREQSMMIESLRGIVTLRLFNREASRLALWQARLMDSMNASVSVSRINNWQICANSLIFGLETIVSVWLAFKFVLAGGFSLGMVFAYLAYKAQFLTKAASLIDHGANFRLLSLHLERLSDIALADQDVAFLDEPAEAARLLGKIELRDVSFRYSDQDPLVFCRVNLIVEPGEHIVICGPSGGGKSTLAKIILGLQEPTSGMVLVDDRPLHEFGLRNYRDQIGAVLQDDSLFAGSVRRNISMFDEEADDARIAECMAAVHLDQDVQGMPSG